MSTEVRTPPYAWYVLGLLLLTYILNFVDRQILSVVAQDIKTEMGLSDAQLGFLMGPAFAACNVLASFPLARLADMVRDVTGVVVPSNRPVVGDDLFKVDCGVEDRKARAGTDMVDSDCGLVMDAG